ncbi:MAG: hypothetical protein ABIJ08_03705 [Nanoarchaeota archaeon]
MRQVLYHGTNYRYHNDMVKKHGIYRHDDGGRVQLSHLWGYAQAFAHTRAEDYREYPVVLAIDREHLHDIDETYVWPTTSFLPFEHFRVLEARDVDLDPIHRTIEEICIGVKNNPGHYISREIGGSLRASYDYLHYRFPNDAKIQELVGKMRKAIKEHLGLDLSVKVKDF